MKIQEPPQEAEKRITLRRQEARLPYVALVYHVPAFPHPDAFPLEVMSQILAGGKSSRLYRKMVYEEQLALETGADFPFNSRDPHLFYVSAQAMPGKSAEQIEQRLHQEITDWGKTPPTREEIERAKNQIEASYIFVRIRFSTRGCCWEKIRPWAVGGTSKNSCPVSGPLPRTICFGFTGPISSPPTSRWACCSPAEVAIEQPFSSLKEFREGLIGC